MSASLFPSNNAISAMLLPSAIHSRQDLSIGESIHLGIKHLLRTDHLVRGILARQPVRRPLATYDLSAQAITIQKRTDA